MNKLNFGVLTDKGLLDRIIAGESKRIRVKVYERLMPDFLDQSITVGLASLGKGWLENKGGELYKVEIF